MARAMKTVCAILVCSCLVLASGCNLTLGPKVETRYVITMPGVPVIILENVDLQCRVLTDESGDAVQQDVGGWIAMPPEHWESVRREVEKLRGKQ